MLHARSPRTQPLHRTPLPIATHRARLRNARDHFIAHTPWPSPPPGPLVAIADALVQIHQGKPWTLYGVLLRPVDAHEATISSPLLWKGTEHTHGGWQAALAHIDREARKRIVALVCDGAMSLMKEAQQSGWIIQRCHFHLRYRIANYVRVGKLGRHPGLARRILRMTDTILTTRDERMVARALQRLRLLIPAVTSQGLRITLAGILKYSAYYRAYLRYPELNLPTTTNSIEAVFSEIRNLQYQARGFSTINAFYRWAIALLKLRKKATCNGRKYQPN